MARRAVLVLLSCSFAVMVGDTLPASGADPGASSRPVLVAQARAPIVAQTAAPQPRPRLISLDFKDADINNILRILAEFSGLNIVSSDDVKGKVTVKLSNVPWQQALDSVVRAAKLAYVQEGNIIRVDKLENLSKEATEAFRDSQRDLESQQRRREFERLVRQQDRDEELNRLTFEDRKKDLGPLVDEVIPIKYGHVGVKRTSTIDFLTDIVTTVEEKGIEEAITGGVKKEENKAAGLLSPRGQISIDPRTNSVVLRDTAERIAIIRQFVARLDVPTPGVLIEARIVEVNRDDARNFGVVWGGAFTPRAGQNSPIVDVRGSGTARGVGTSPSGQPTTASSFPANPLNSLLGSSPFTAGNLFGMTFGWLASGFALDIQLQALEGEGRAKIISTPNTLTLDNQPANIANGQKVPIISLTSVNGAQQASVTYQDVTTRLQVTPHVVREDGQIILAVSVKRETLGPNVGNSLTLTAFEVDTRQAQTQVRIPDGGTVVIGGLRVDQDVSEQQGLPWLRNIPVLGWLFKNDATARSRRDMMVFLTAKVVENPGQAAATPDAVPGVSSGALPASGPAPVSQAPAPKPKTVTPAAPTVVRIESSVPQPGGGR